MFIIIKGLSIILLSLLVKVEITYLRILVAPNSLIAILNAGPQATCFTPLLWTSKYLMSLGCNSSFGSECPSRP